MNISEYLRNLVRSGGNVDSTFAADRGNFIRQITGIATNVNQVAKVVNTQGMLIPVILTGLSRIWRMLRG
jgi:hypothetical protein